MPVTAKICGISAPEALDAALTHGAAQLGFVFFPPSPRHLALDEAAALSVRVPSRVQRVGVFVDPEDALLDAAIRSGRLDALQLHKVAPGRAAAIRARFGLETWVAIAIKTRSDLAQGGTYAEAADHLLYDAKTPDDAALPGGMGLRFDWALLQGHRPALPWSLSGGLSASNVAEAVRVTGATAVDVSSGVETAPGVKDVDKIAAFLKAVATL